MVGTTKPNSTQILHEGTALDVYLNNTVSDPLKANLASPDFSGIPTVEGAALLDEDDLDVSIQAHDDSLDDLAGKTIPAGVLADLTTAQVFKDKVLVSPSDLAVSASTLDLANTDYFKKTLSGATTFIFSNALAGGTGFFLLRVVGGITHAVTWPASVTKWVGEIPTLDADDLVMFVSEDNGVSWIGVHLGVIV